ncbi:MAG: aminoacetone oxidase family FAD-binding enzyme [Clostridia bacterium]|nr:aminoacetone oxidase family FAD-binding enzyme [Clostridia bacterium]
MILVARFFMQNNNILIIGGGASGLMCALTACKNGKSVTILEGAFKVGKKILASGNGRCNLTNKNITKACYNNFPVQLNKFNNTQTIKLFESLGLETYFDDEGRCYPVSNHSSSVLEVLINALKNHNCNIITNCMVKNITKQNDVFSVESSQGVFNANKVVVATGGNTMVNILKGFNISFKKFMPSLCGLKTSENTKLVAGIRQNALVTLSTPNFNYSEEGEIIFREDGVSGICIFNLSSKLNWFGLAKATLSLNLLPNKTIEQILAMLESRKQKLSTLNAINFFDGLFINNLGQEILNRAKISLQTPVSKLTDKNLITLAKTIMALKFNVVGMLANNQVHHGGVQLSELTNNLECKKISGLYVCGEVVNVDGVCGGYNLQWAWSSGHAVGESL